MSAIAATSASTYTLRTILENPELRRVSYMDRLPASSIIIAEPSPDIWAEIKAHKERMRVQQAESEKSAKEIEASNKLENNNTYLPNIKNLILESALKMKGFVEVDIEDGIDGIGNIYGNFGDKPVRSLKEYLTFLNGYIAEKSGSSTPPASTQPSTPAETTPPATGASPETSDTGAPATSTPTPSEPAAVADPNYIDPVGKPGQNHIIFPNVASLTGEMAAAVYKQVSSMVQSRDISDSVIHARNGDAGTYSVETYMSWLAKRAATSIVA